MTAEIAILNKSAVALAADSAVTISAGSREEKIFDSADKLFALCHHNQIGVMIYNNMGLAETPIPLLINMFRDKCESFDTVKEAAFTFLNHLNEFAASSPRNIKNDITKRVVEPIAKELQKKFNTKMNDLLQEVRSGKLNREDLKPDSIKTRMNSILDEVISLYEEVILKLDDCSFIGDAPFKPGSITKSIIRKVIEKAFSGASANQRKRMRDLLLLVIKKRVSTNAVTGIVVAGFGKNELFPTLLSFEIDGMVDDRLRYNQTNHIDIDRSGPKAKVIPFAQKEMVERFLYGLDEDIAESIVEFSEQTVKNIRERILNSIDFQISLDRDAIDENAKSTETAFLNGLRDQAFKAIRENSEAEIEDMVEFMPKPELTRMAEALINLTSIKRRVSRGLETVGGPIDVAVISRHEGFVWIKRKRYFPPELNPRYFERVRMEVGRERRSENDEDAPAGRPGYKGGKSSIGTAERNGNDTVFASSRQQDQRRNSESNATETDPSDEEEYD